MARRSGKILPPQVGGFGITPGPMIQDGGNLSPAARALYAVIWYHRVMSDSFPPMEELALQIGSKTKGPVIKAIEELEASSWLKVIRVHGRQNDYQLLDGSGKTVEVTDEAHAKAKVERTEKPKSDGMQPALIKWWTAAFQKTFGVPYEFLGGRDAKAAAAIVEYYRRQGLRAVAMTLAEDPSWLNGGEFGMFVKQVWHHPGIRADKFLSSQVKTLHGFHAVMNQIQPMIGKAGLNTGSSEDYAHLERKAL